MKSVARGDIEVSLHHSKSHGAYISLLRTQITSFGDSRNRESVITRSCQTPIITEMELVIEFF